MAFAVALGAGPLGLTAAVLAAGVGAPSGAAARVGAAELGAGAWSATLRQG
ncbi:hypothetical protein [Streptomyces sp. NPDC002044]|uniref:hypothetical protein n=1 Tax=Streptomyces sp. NPDC002044 TaxID=3154662 RepID=UPI003318498A